MISYIERKYLCEDCTVPDARKKACILLSLIGMGLNLLLFSIKYGAGLLCGSIAVTADAFNNFADAGSYILALLGIILGNIKPSRRYPFGYGRLEYISGVIISAAILLLGVRTGISCVEKIIRPEHIEASPLIILMLIVSVTIKGYMYLYNRRVGGKINSAGMEAAATDSLCDCFATVAIMISIAIEQLTGALIDGYCGLLVAVCIFYAGAMSARECLSPLLGMSAEDATLRQLTAIIERYPQINGMEEVAVHDYGPSRKLLTMTVAVSGDPRESLKELKDEIESALSVRAVIGIRDEKNREKENKPSADGQEYNRKSQAQESETGEC